MKTVQLREYKDLSEKQKNSVRASAVAEEVEFQILHLNELVDTGVMTEEEFWEAIGCSKRYGESTPWFVSSVYYEHHKKEVDAEVMRSLNNRMYDDYGNSVYLMKNANADLTFKEDIRQAIADYMSSEGCSCCQDIHAHRKHKKRLGEMLDVPMYKDKSGYDFSQFRSKQGK